MAHGGLSLWPRRRVLAAALTAALLLAAPASAARPSPAQWWPPGGMSWGPSNDVVEQQSPGGCCVVGGPRVLNPGYALETGCSWDADDQRWRGVGGYLDPGASITSTGCLYADWTTHLLALRVETPGVVGTLTLDGHVALTVSAGKVGCIAGPDYQLFTHGTLDTPQFDPGWTYSPLLTTFVAGGVTRATSFTYTLTNVTARRIRAVEASVRLVLAGFALVAVPTGCPYPINFSGSGTPLYPIGHDPQIWTWVGAPRS